MLVIAVQTNLQPDPNQQSVDVLRLIFLVLNDSTIATPNGTLAFPPVQENPLNKIATASGLVYASLLISLLVALVAILGKQWLNRYLRHVGRSMVERCGDRQLKYDGLQEWPFHLFVESLLVMLQVALLLLACGLCLWMVTINIPVAVILIILTAVGVLFYFGIAVAGASSYACPFQTPASTVLCGLWKKFRPLWKKVESAVPLEGTQEVLHTPPESDSSPHGTNPLTHDTNPPHCNPDHPSQETNSSSWDTPTPTPASTALHCLWKKIWSYTTLLVHLPWKKVVFPISSTIHHFKQAIAFRSRQRGHPQSPMIPLGEI